MTSRILAVTLAFALAVLAVPGQVLAVQAPPNTGLISGTAHSQAGQTMVNTTVRLRNVATGQISGTTTSSSSGAFSFTGLNPGQYVVEVVNSAGQVIGTSSTVTLAAGAMAATGVGVTTAAAAAAAAAAGGSFFGTALGITTLAAIGGGIAGVTVAATRPTASPSR